MNSETAGISVILCCYNSTKRLAPTLLALSRQSFKSLDWEIILVDNNSNDETRAKAEYLWRSFGRDVKLNIVPESRQGLANARMKGIYESQFQIVLFCDDDNWLGENYLERVHQIFVHNPGLAACGGLGIPEFETEKPSWFDNYAEAYATGPQDMNVEGETILSLYGAGMAIRKEAIRNLLKTGFKPNMSGRTGTSLSSSEDTELTNALVIQGNRLFFDEDLKFRHFLAKERLTAQYLRKLFKSFGKDGPLLNLYYSYQTKRFWHRQIRHWPVHLSLSLIRLIKYLISPPKPRGRSIYFVWNLAYIKQLFLIGLQYERLKRNIVLLKNQKPPHH